MYLVRSVAGWQHAGDGLRTCHFAHREQPDFYHNSKILCYADALASTFTFVTELQLILSH